MSTHRPARLLAAALAIAAALPVVSTAVPAHSAPVAADDAAYARCGRVFPDPHAYRPAPAPPPGQSPWARGNAACRAVDFLGWDETIAGLRYLESKLPRYLEVVDLSDPDGPFAGVLAAAGADGRSAGLPTEGLGRERAPMYLVRVTDEASTAVTIDRRQHFAFALSIHGIERAGVEGGVRAIEDLATWAACEADRGVLPSCAAEGPYPHPIMETIPDASVGAGEALRRSSLWFVLANPDGWRRGDKSEGRFFYQRYNGNGMDLNRDWPSIGYTFRPFTPSSEPETRAIGTVLRDVSRKWTGGIDLHGQLVDRAFSFTMLRGGQRPFDKDRRVLQYVKGAFADAETRLSWSPVIKPNDAPPSCVTPSFIVVDPSCDATNRVYGVQWGTTWDTIGYTTTGSFGDWMDSPIGLDADGIDNEMSMSHLSNCGVGSCYLTDFEQLHVDGNKSLIYAMVHYSLLPEDTSFRYAGDAAWLHHDERVRSAGSATSTRPDAFALPPQPGIDARVTVAPGVPGLVEFEVRGPADGVFNGAISVTATSTNLTGVSPGSALVLAVDKYRAGEEDPNAPAPGWSEQNSYYNQSPGYLQAGARVDVNSPLPGRYRLRVEGAAVGQVDARIRFLTEQAWPDPGQRPYDVSNLDFFAELRPFVAGGDDALRPAPVDAVLDGRFDLATVDSLVVADGAFLAGWDRATEERTAPQPPVTATMVLGPPSFGIRVRPATTTFHEFDVGAGHGSLEAVLDAPTSADPDLFLQRRLPDGSWTGDLAQAVGAEPGRERLTYRRPRAGRYRIEAVNSFGAPGDAELTVTFALPVPPPSGPGSAAAARYDANDEARLLERLRAFLERGGNLVLTDDGLRVVEWLGLVPPGSVGADSGYAGFVEFSLDGGETSTYGDPLAANVQQPGAAEGPAHRRQTSEPVPLGYTIMDASGGDAASMPQWTVDRGAWEAAGGRTVGTANGGVALGELPVGAGRVRILGSLLPRPTEEYDHPYGLASYGITYSGYELFRNLLDTSTGGLGGGAAAGGTPPGGAPLAATGPGASGPPFGLPAVAAALGLIAALAGFRLTRRSTAGGRPSG